jgi:hypothetical protein
LTSDKPTTGVVDSANLNCLRATAFDQGDIHTYISGEQWLVIKNYPEFACYRDIAFYFKYFMNTEDEAFPRPAPWTQKHAELKYATLSSGIQGNTVIKLTRGITGGSSTWASTW